MPQEEETIIVPSKAVQKAKTVKEDGPNYVRWVVVLVGVYFALVAMLAYLPMSGYMKVLSLILGAFILSDVHHSIKYHVKHRD